MLCKNYQIDYEEINLDDTQKRVEFFEKLQEQHDDDSICTVPQIFVDDQWLGGYPQFRDYINPQFNFEKLIEVTRTITKNLNKVIDQNYYPTKETQTSNKRHRPIGIGVQGLADVFAQLKISFDSPEALELNNKIFETIYYGAMLESLEISKKREPLMKEYKEILNLILNRLEVTVDDFYSNINFKEYFDQILNNKSETLNSLKKIDLERFISLHNQLKPIVNEINRNEYMGSYSSFAGSTLDQGQFQFDLWEKYSKKKLDLGENYVKLNYDWDLLRTEMKKFGVRNSLLLAPMPTASTSQILGNNECFEPYTSNIYTRRTLAGEYIIINKWLLQDMISLGLWSKNTKDQMLLNDGSISHISEIPTEIKNIYKTVWEIKQKVLIDQAVGRGKFICQSQSLNLFLASPSAAQVTSMHFYGWENGLKTGMYYLRTKAASSAQKFTVDPSKNNQTSTDKNSSSEVVCESCSA
tara:strand:- start:46 stop:1452 length:1407 start_codon:yes stop_codon:yes gene_type:complete